MARDEELLEPLKKLGIPASGLDTDMLVSAGRRRVRTRRWAAISGSALATVVAVAAVAALPDRVVPPDRAAVPSYPHAAAPPAFPTACAAELLALPANAVQGGFVEDGDASGRYLVGGYVDGNGTRHPALWDNGVFVPLNPPGQENMTIAVNSDGVVVGSSSTTGEGQSQIFNWIYRDGVFDLLILVYQLPEKTLGAVDINARGEVLFDSRIRVFPGTPPPPPRVWQAGEFRDLEMPSGYEEITAMAIDEDGSVIGRGLIESGFSGERGLLWTPDGKVHELAVPNGFGPGGAFRKLRGGQAMGGFQQPGQPEHVLASLVGDPLSGQYTNVDEVTMAWDVNSYGWVSGFVRDANGLQTPTIVGAGQVISLPVPAGSSFGTEALAVTISDDARNVGGNVDQGAEMVAPALWRCA